MLYIVHTRLARFFLNAFHRTPCLGATKKIKIKIPVVVNAMTGPDGKSVLSLKYRSKMDETAPKVADKTIIIDKRFVSIYAVEAGVISIETTRITPTV